ncbi:MAG: hypothetical protein LBS19_00920 [Clostridiales bacterium]|nr:hypothetical protein [Clostridiales bacterium]
MKRGIAIAGNLIVDYIKYIERYPAKQALTVITHRDLSTGGLCCNCVITLAKLDPSLPIKALGIVGEDEAGDYILSRFSAYPSVDVSNITRQGTTSYTDVMTEAETGHRTFFAFKGASALLNPSYFNFSRLEADILHIGYILIT